MAGHSGQTLSTGSYSSSGTHPEKTFHARVTFGTGRLRDTGSEEADVLSWSAKETRLFYTNRANTQKRWYRNKLMPSEVPKDVPRIPWHRQPAPQPSPQPQSVV